MGRSDTSTIVVDPNEIIGLGAECIGAIFSTGEAHGKPVKQQF